MAQNDPVAAPASASAPAAAPSPPVDPGSSALPADGTSPAPADSDAPAPAGSELAGGTGDSDPSVPPVEPVAPGAAKPPKIDHREARIARLTARLKEAEEKLKEQPETPVLTGEQLTASQIETRARELASQQVAINKFNDDCAKTAEKGKAEFPDFDQRISSLRQLVSGDQDTARQVAYNQLVSVAIETGAAPAILHTLGGDLDEAERILNLPVHRMAIELARMADRPVEAKVSAAPKPITPVSGRGAPHTAIAPDDPDRADNLSKDEWFKRRQAQVDAKNTGSGRRAMQ